MQVCKDCKFHCSIGLGYNKCELLLQDKFKALLSEKKELLVSKIKELIWF